MARQDLDLVVLGECNPDLILSGDQVEPEFGQVERLVDAADLTIGGSGSIVACGAARLGLRTAMVGVVGNDVFGRFMTGALAQRGVQTGWIVEDAAMQTGLTVILDRGDDRALLTFSGTIATLSETVLDPQLLRRTRHVHVSSYFLQTSLIQALPELFAQARKAGVTTSVDPNWDPSGQWDNGLRELLASTDVFLPNAEEAMRISGRPDPVAAALQLARAGPLVVTKRGSEGAVGARSDGTLTHARPLQNIEPVDTTGAGDCFDAGVIAALLFGWSTDRALSLGCACGGLSTRARGGTGAQPTLDEALAALGEPT